MDHGLACPLMHDIAESVPPRFGKHVTSKPKLLGFIVISDDRVPCPRTLALSSARDYILHNVTCTRAPMCMSVREDKSLFLSLSISVLSDKWSGCLIARTDFFKDQFSHR